MIDFGDFEKISYTSDDGNTMDVFRDTSEDLILGFIREVEGGFKAKVFEAAFIDDFRGLGSTTKESQTTNREVEFHNYNYALKYILKTCRVSFPEGFDDEGDSAF